MTLINPKLKLLDIKPFLEKLKKAWPVLLLITVFIIGSATGFFYSNWKEKTSVSRDIYLQFLNEVYDTIKSNYWMKISDEQLVQLFKFGTEKLANKPQVLEKNTKQATLKMAEHIMAGMNKDEKKEFSAKLADMVLANLEPFGRSRLYTTKEEKQLAENVKNIDSSSDLYQFLEVKKSATQEEIKKAYENKVAELSPLKETSPDALEKLAQAERAFQTLSRAQTREIYDKTRIEPTVFAKTLTSDIVHLRLTKLSPQTFEEFQKITQDLAKNSKAASLILDLRGNIGGAIDLLQYFLGPFIGSDQYAYEFFHQGEKQVFKTKTGWLPSLLQYKKTVILIDGQTQSSAELMAAVLKKYNVGILVGTKTKGWGTIENTFPISQQLDLKEKYSVFLAHSLALRDDNQPIEGKGVDPVINIKDKDWQEQLFDHFSYQPLVEAVAEILKD